ncbi:UDP-glucuronosyltransferase 2B15 [Cephus cinctus]|uniref:UDP-glucuronosyltransferase 2B15 n=1 Tax=Cephus cinctus TaxID=211228 RepID=A0AAJ7C259_CEPCN|nr:UDP-glucuronosyltransferase 2B15 [Cephus cinctus]
MARIVIVLMVSLIFLLNRIDSARILGIFPHPSHSHQIFFHSLTSELSRRGHELVIFTPKVTNDTSLVNFTEISLVEAYAAGWKEIVNYSSYRELWVFFDACYRAGVLFSESILSHPEMEKILNPQSDKKFDLILIQIFYVDALHALSSILNVPMIGLTSLAPIGIHHHTMGNPPLLSYIPDVMGGQPVNMNFWQRIINIYCYGRQIFEFNFIHLKKQERVLKKYFGNNAPDIRDVSKNISLLLASTQYPIYHPRPDMPSVKLIGGLRFYKSTPREKMSPRLQNILDNAKEGFIYFSLGSNVKLSQLSEENRNVFVHVLAELPYKVIWKCDLDDLPIKAKNIFLEKWVPQQDILAHSNILLFLYQGGQQSTEEAINNGVPLVGFPVFSDQRSNVNNVVSLGIGQKIELSSMTKESMKKTVLEVIQNPRYKKNVIELRNYINDRMNHPMEEAIWWTEYVIRHKGAPALRNRYQDVPWYQMEGLDILIFFIILLYALLYSMYLVTRCIISKIFLRARSSRNLDRNWKSD